MIVYMLRRLHLIDGYKLVFATLTILKVMFLITQQYNLRIKIALRSVIVLGDGWPM